MYNFLFTTLQIVLFLVCEVYTQKFSVWKTKGYYQDKQKIKM